MRFILPLLVGVACVAACDTPTIPTTNDGVEPELHGVAQRGQGPGALRVMTRNVYVGANVDAVLAVGSAEELPLAVATAFQELVSTDFPSRAQSLAREVAWTRPHLIGLQEISTIRVQSPGDLIAGGTRPAEEVLFDYLQILMAALQHRGLDYRVAAIVQNADVEVPMVTSPAPTFDDIRLTDYDVILARHDVSISDARAVNYQARLSIPFGNGLIIEIPRGFTAVTADVHGRRYRFVNTHLEPAPIPDLLPIQLAQAQELLASLADEQLPVVLVGDLNTVAPTGETYVLVRDAGFEDAWLHRIRSDEGFTCCHASDLRNDAVNFDRRIDLVLVRNSARPHRPFTDPVVATVVGDEPRNREGGLWPSDHGGVVAGVRIAPAQHAHLPKRRW